MIVQANQEKKGITGVRQVCFLDKIWYEKIGELPQERHPFEEFESYAIIGKEIAFCVVVVSSSNLIPIREKVWEWMRDHGLEIRFVVLAPRALHKEVFFPIPADSIYLVLPDAMEPEMLPNVIDNAFFSMQVRFEKLKLESRLALTSQDMQRLTRVGQSLSTERDFDALIGLILHQARELVDADAGSIYVAERNPVGDRPTHLRFKKSALVLNANEFLLPIDDNSIAGHVANTNEPLVIDDVYKLPESSTYKFNEEFDKTHNYHTKSMLVIPMTNHRGINIGVIQLINKKRIPQKVLTIQDMMGSEVLPFTNKDIELAKGLAGQAAVAIQNNLLLQDINQLFEGFVTAAVTAIEQRDPTTSGHSFRVSELTVGLAQSLDRLNSGPFSQVKFSTEQIREIRYASLLHDFGKVGVREKVLVKAKKLYDHELDLIRWRFLYLRKSIEKEYQDKKLSYITESGEIGFSAFQKYMNLELRDRLEQVDEMFNVINTANEPTVIAEGNFDRLGEISQSKFKLDDGQEIPFLRENELISLSIRRGNLDQRERLEIESHVSHTYRFLIQIPWTTDLRRVPDIAHAHHEKLNGTGYPRRLSGEEISVQSRMMTIADIYDALTAPDRPYKKSLSVERALDILHEEARENHIDGRLLQIFIDSDVYKIIMRDRNA